jgi:hypothetical protein
LKLYRALSTLAVLPGPVHIRLQYSNIAGHVLPPGWPTRFGFLRMHEVVPYANGRLTLAELAPADFEPENVTRNLARDIYAAFGYEADRIPFWDEERRRFEFASG